MKYHRFMSWVWAFVSIISLGTSFMFIGFDETPHAIIACAMCLVAALLHFLHAELGKPIDCSGCYRR